MVSTMFLFITERPLVLASQLNLQLFIRQNLKGFELPQYSLFQREGQSNIIEWVDNVPYLLHRRFE